MSQPTIEDFERLLEENARLRELLGSKILLRARDHIDRDRTMHYPYDADLSAYCYYGVEFITDHLLENFWQKEIFAKHGISED